MGKRGLAFSRLAVAGLALGVLLAGLLSYAGGSSVQGASYALQTAYPPPEDFPYVAPFTNTPPAQGQRTPLPTRDAGTPLPEPTLGDTAVPDPNLFLTEDAQIGDSRVTPGLQTLEPTSTPTNTKTPLPTATIPVTVEPTATPTPVPPLLGEPGTISWPLVAVGFFLPVTLLSFGVLALTVAREANRPS